MITHVPQRVWSDADNSDGQAAGLTVAAVIAGSRSGPVWAVATTLALGLVMTGVAFGSILRRVLGDGWLGTDVDLVLSNFAVENRSGWVTDFMRQVTDLGSTAALTSVALSTIAGMVMLRRYRLAAVMLIASVGSSTLTFMLKTMIDRPRPFTNGDLVFASDSSFPSGHTLDSAAIYGALVFIVGCLLISRRARLGVWAIGATLAIAIGVSRVYLGVHWASDVAAGWMLGLALLAGVAGLVFLDERVARFLKPDARVRAPMLQTLSARSSILGIVGLTVLTAFLIGVQIKV